VRNRSTSGISVGGAVEVAVRTLFWTLVFLLDGEAGSPSMLGVLALAVIVAVVGLLAVLDAGGGR